MKFNKNEFGWKEKVSVNTNLNNDTFNIKFLPDMNTNSNMYIVNIIDLEEKTTYRVNTNINKNVLVLRYIFSDGTLKNLYSLNGKYILGKVEIYICRKTDTLIEFDVNNIRHTCNIDEVNKTVEITKKALILNTDNAQEYTPTKDYHPATKKYVDDKFVMNENIETIYTIPMDEMQKCNNGTGRYISNIDFDELFINHEKYIYYANYKDDTLIPVTYDSKYNRFTTGVLDKTSDYNIILGFDLGTHRMYPFNSGSTGVKAYTFTNDLIIKRVPILNVNEVATREYVDDSILIKNKVGTKTEPIIAYELPAGIYLFNGYVELGTNFEMIFDTPKLCNIGDWDNSEGFAVISFLDGFLVKMYADGSSADNDYDWNLTYKYAPQFSFNSDGNLVVTIDGVSKTFVPKPE